MIEGSSFVELYRTWEGNKRLWTQISVLALSVIIPRVTGMIQGSGKDGEFIVTSSVSCCIELFREPFCNNVIVKYMYL